MILDAAAASVAVVLMFRFNFAVVALLLRCCCAAVSLLFRCRCRKGSLEINDLVWVAASTLLRHKAKLSVGVKRSQLWSGRLGTPAALWPELGSWVWTSVLPPLSVFLQHTLFNPCSAPVLSPLPDCQLNGNSTLDFPKSPKLAQNGSSLARFGGGSREEHILHSSYSSF